MRWYARPENIAHQLRVMPQLTCRTKSPPYQSRNMFTRRGQYERVTASI